MKIRLQIGLGLCLLLLSISAGHAFSLPIPTRPTSFPLQRPSFSTAHGVVEWGNYSSVGSPIFITNAVQVSAGYGYTLALKSDGTVVGWGYNANGECNVPADLTNVVQISAGFGSSFALRSDGTLVGWGDLGWGDYSKDVPAGLNNVVQVSQSDKLIIALKSDGTVVTWPGTSYVPSIATNVVQVEATDVGYIVLKTDGTVVAWGGAYDTFTNTGIWTLGSDPVPGQPRMASLYISGLNNIVQISTQKMSSSACLLALKNDGTLVGCGQAFGSFKYIQIPAGLTNVIQVSVGNQAGTLVVDALKNDGTIVSWGGRNIDSYGQVPTGLTNVVQISAGIYSHSAAIAPVPQTIRLEAIPNHSYGDPPFTVTLPTVSSGLPVNLMVKSGPATLSSNTLTITGLGIVTLAANQAGNKDYAAAPEVTTSFMVSQGNQVINFPDIGTISLTTNPYTLNATSSISLPVTYAVLSGPARLISSNQLALTGAGWITVQADQPGDENWQAAPSVTRSFNIRMGSQSISFPPLNSPYTPFFTPKSWEFGDEIYPLTDVVASSGLPVNFTSSSPKVAAIVSNNMVILGVGTTTIIASQAGDSNWLAATPVSQTLVVGRSYQRIYTVSSGMDAAVIPSFVYGSKKNLTLQPSLFKSSSGLPVRLSVKSGPALLKGTTLSITGAGNVVLEAKQAGNKTYLPSEEFTIPFTVEQAEQTITPMVTIPGKANGSAPFGVKLPAASSGLPVSLSIQSGPARISGTNVTLTGAGTVVVAADQPGNRNYFAAPTVTTSFTVAKGSQSITWAAPAKVTNGGSTVQLAAKASSGLRVSYTTYAGNIRVMTNGLVTILGSGTASITASQPGDANWNAARSLSQNLVVTIPPIMTNGASNRITGIASASSIPSLPVRPASFPLTRPSSFGSVVAWGDNTYGETKLPVGLTNIVQLSSRGLHSLALRTNGTVTAWGWNAYGQTAVPTTLTNAVQVAAGASFSAALRANGSVALWGDNSLGQTNLPAGLTNAVQIAAGSHHALALRSDGTVNGWGWNGYGQTDVPAEATNIVQITAGYFHSAALKSDGTVVAWGDDTYGEIEVPPNLTNVVRIAAGLNHTVALKSDGTVAAWGWDNAGQCDVPSDLTGVAQIATGGNTVYAITTNGTLVTWGDNSYGQRKPPKGLSGVYQFVLGLYHALGLNK